MSPQKNSTRPRARGLRTGRTLLRAATLCALSLLFQLAPAEVSAQTSYRKPPQTVLDVLNAPVTPTASINPTRDTMLLATGVRYPPVAELAEPMLRLAGLRINPNTSGPHRGSYYVAFSLKRISDGVETKVALPAGAQAGSPQWSADGKLFAFTNTTPAGIELWVGEAATAKVRRLNGVRVNAVYGPTLQWMPDNKTLLVQLVPAKRGAPPAATKVPTGPNEQESSGKAAGAATFQDLLKTPHDEDLFDYYATSQLALVDSSNGRMTTLGQPSIYADADPSPDGRHIYVARVHRPYSYLHPANLFPQELEVWDANGKLLKKIASQPLADQVPIQGVRTGPRSVQWRPTEPATLLWAEALDGGDPKKKVSHRDRLLIWKAPFAGEPREFFKTEHRYQGAQWGERGGLLFVNDFDRERRWTRTQLIDVDNPQAAAKTVWSRNVSDQYRNPGTPVMRTLPNGARVMLQHGDLIYLIGSGATPEGDRPFLDRLNLQTLKTERIFRSSAELFETPVALLRDDASEIITRIESPTEPPNYFVRQIEIAAVSAGNPEGPRWSKSGSPVRALTQFTDPTPQLRGITKRLVKYKRKDGVELSFTLYLPPGYKEGTRLPTVVWAYPLEYTDTDVAGQVSGSTQRFTTIGGPSHLFFLLEGYAVLDNATMPVVGDPETVNDTYVEQIVSSAQAAIDKAVDLGVTDPDRVGVGGHSYGAFMTANLLAHSDLFRAGIARSGAYNRTLTPFGFQSERRTLWEAPEMYIKVSPFMLAHKIKEPILLIHGEADNNTGTYPIQSERMYQAIRGTGGTVRLVMLPLESHGYAARESTEHTLYEMITWFNKWVKNAPPRKETSQKTEK